MSQQTYGGYPYFQAYPPPTPYMGGVGPVGPNQPYPIYAPPQPQQQPASSHPSMPGPTRYSFDAAAYTHLNNGAPTTSRRHNSSVDSVSRHHRRANTVSVQQPTQPQQQPSGSGAGILKSAMKKTMTAFNNVENPRSNFLNAFNSQQHPATQTPATRPRAYSNPSNPQNLSTDESAETMDNPFHMIVSFHGYNELHIEHVLQLALDELRKIIWPLWPHGVESDSVVGHTCIVRFKNAPWDMSGPNVKHTYKLIAEFFRLFQQRGYSFQTAIDLRTTTPRFIFQVTKPDNSQFFLAYFSQEGRRLSLINPPQHVDLAIGSRLRSMFGRKISTVESEEEFMRSFEVKRKANSVSEVDTGLFFLEVLRILNQFGFHLDVSIPLSRRGPLGLRNQREILVFKGITVATA